MDKLAAAFAAVTKILATYPALSSALVNVAVIITAYFGLPLTGPEMLYLVGVVTTLFGVIVHSNVVPLAKLPVPPVRNAAALAATIAPLVSTVEIPIVKSDPVV